MSQKPVVETTGRVVVVQNADGRGDAERRSNLIAAAQTSFLVIVKAGSEIGAATGALLVIGIDVRLRQRAPGYPGGGDVAADLTYLEVRECSKSYCTSRPA